MRYYLSGIQSCTATIRVLRSALSAVPALLPAIMLAACSPSVESLKINAYNLADSLEEGNPEVWPQNWKIEQIEDDPALFKITNKDADAPADPAYSTVLKECGIREKTDTASTTRQLLVGLQDIRVQREENFLYDDQRVFFKEFEATLDDHKLFLISFSVRKDDCVYDSVVWSDEKNRNSIIEWLSTRSKQDLPKVYFAYMHKD